MHHWRMLPIKPTPHIISAPQFCQYFIPAAIRRYRCDNNPQHRPSLKVSRSDRWILGSSVGTNTSNCDFESGYCRAYILHTHVSNVVYITQTSCIYIVIYTYIHIGTSIYLIKNKEGTKIHETQRGCRLVCSKGPSRPEQVPCNKLNF